MTSGGFLGLDPELVGQMATRFDNEATTINSLIGKMDSVVSANIPAAWKGNDANTFQNDWNSNLKPQLRNVETALRNAAAKARKNVADQQGTSSTL